LRKAGVKLKFGGQPSQVLSILLERPGELVTREQLQKRLWPDTFVDVDHNLNTAINKIREALGDSAETPRYVETIPRRGYRFIGEIEPSPPAPSPAVTPIEPIQPTPSIPKWVRIGAGLAVLLVLGIAAEVGIRSFRHAATAKHENEDDSLNPVPFTALPGAETSPTFSPDGSRIAFAWNDDPASKRKGFDLYLKAIGSETMLRLTQQPSASLSPAWSPDGSEIAFHRVAGAETGIYVVPALGGPERKLRSTRIPRTNYTHVDRNNFALISWSQNGNRLAFADAAPGDEHTRIYVMSMETREARQISVRSDCVDEGVPAFSHNGESLAYWCFREMDGGAVINVLPSSGGVPRTVSSFPSLQALPNGLTWSADDKRLIYSLYSFKDSTDSELGEVSVSDGATKRLAFAGSAMSPAISLQGNKLAYSSLFTRVGIWRRDLLHPDLPGVELAPSSRAQFDAQYSPDGKRIAFVSARSGRQGIWISSEDGSNLVQLSDAHDVSGSPQWSQDGTKVAFDSFPQDHWEIYVADVAEQKPRKLVTNLSEVIRPFWSRDGKWIYFRSTDTGKKGVYRCPASGGDAIVVSKDIDGIDPRESLDGKTIYFASLSEKSTLMQQAVGAKPGTELAVDGLPRLNNTSLWALAPGGIYFVSAEQPTRSVQYFDFASKQIRRVFESDYEFGTSLSVSPDGRWLIYAQSGDASSDIMLVDHFH